MTRLAVASFMLVTWLSSGARPDAKHRLAAHLQRAGERKAKASLVENKESAPAVQKSEAETDAELRAKLDSQSMATVTGQANAKREKRKKSMDRSQERVLSYRNINKPDHVVKKSFSELSSLRDEVRKVQKAQDKKDLDKVHALGNKMFDGLHKHHVHHRALSSLAQRKAAGQMKKEKEGPSHPHDLGDADKDIQSEEGTGNDSEAQAHEKVLLHDDDDPYGYDYHQEAAPKTEGAEKVENQVALDTADVDDGANVDAAAASGDSQTAEEAAGGGEAAAPLGPEAGTGGHKQQLPIGVPSPGARLRNMPDQRPDHV